MIQYTRVINPGDFCGLQIKKENHMLTQQHKQNSDKSSNKVRVNQICIKYKWNQMYDKPFFFYEIDNVHQGSVCDKYFVLL